MSRPHILMIEDDELDRYILRRALRKRWPDALLSEACDGIDAMELLEAAGEAQPDLIMLDINMPRMGGLEFLEAYYVDSRHTMPVVMMLTSSDREQDREQAGKYACVLDYLTKPVSRATVEALPEMFRPAA